MKIFEMRNIFLFCSVLFLQHLHSQTITAPLRFQSITTEHGLPHNFVHSITQDKKGFIWIGTNYGLARYDGYNFKIFQPDPLKPNSIKHKPNNLLFADSKDNLWIFSSQGSISKMNLKTESFTQYLYDSTNKYFLGIYYCTFYEDSDTNLWLTTTNGVFLYNKEHDNFISTFSGKDINGVIGTPLADDNCGNLWFVIDKKIRILNKKTFSISTLGELVSDNKYETVEYNSVISDKTGQIWLTTVKNGLLCYNPNARKVTSYLEKIPNLIRSYIDNKGNLLAISREKELYKLLVCKKEDIEKKIYKSYVLCNIRLGIDWLKLLDDSEGNIWISSSFGLCKYNFISELTCFEANNLLPYSISANSVEDIFIDRTNNLWVCPLRKGLNKVDLNQKPFRLSAPEIKSLSDLQRNKNVLSIFEDSKQNYWIGGSTNETAVFNKTNGKINYCLFDFSEPISAMHEDTEGNMWLGSYWGTLLKVKPPSLNALPANSNVSLAVLKRFIVGDIRKIVEDKKNNIWIASLWGIMEWNKKKNVIINHSKLYDSLYSYSSFYRTLLIDKNQTLWAGSNNGGLTKYDANKKTFKHYLNNPKSNNTISNNTLYSIYEDNNGYLWVGTGKGLEKFNPVTEVFEHEGINNELTNRSIFSVFPDTSGNLWMSCDVGIAKYNIATKATTIYGKSDGLLNSEFQTTASFLSKSGEILYGGINGLLSFFPSEIKSNQILPKPVITNFYYKNKVVSPGDSVNGRLLLNQQLWETSNISLFHYENEFAIEFSALHFSAPAKIKYQYKLEGFNNEWIYADATKRTAYYTGLPPGKYTFKLKATNNDGLMCLPEDEVRLTITIIPPFWQTLWFKVLLFLSMFSLVLLYIRIKVKALKNKNIQLNKRVKERTYELERANLSLSNRTHDLEEANTVLEERQEEINQQKEEIVTQYEKLEETNQLLQVQQNQILEQNTELDKHRNKLEELVEERTHELEKALVKAEESDMLKTSFLTNMSHEIRTPMNAIIGFSSLLKEQNLSSKRDEFINIIETNGLTLLSLINDILDLSSIQSQQVSLMPLNSNLCELLHKQYGTFQIETNRKQLFLKLNTTRIATDFCMMFDQVRLLQVISNLLSNAIKFTSTGGVEFGIYEATDKVTFYVSDTGIGIPIEVGEAVFDRFYKIETNKTELYRGTGLGLAICKSLVSLWGGTIWYQSELGKGTTFFFTYPISKVVTSNNAQAVANEYVNSINLKDKLVLIAEDEDSNFQLLENFLFATKVRILRAKNGVEAIQIATEQPVDLILMDIKMPIMNGLVASSKIKELFPLLPIIAQTAFAYKNEIEEILNGGINAYIIKPIKKVDLLNIIQRFL